LAPTEPATQPKRQYASFASACLLADDALLLYLNWNGTGKQIHKVWASCAPFCDSDTKLATPNFLRRQKNLPPSAVNQKDPGFGRFSLRAFE
jgi:hypothetical protein